MLNVLNKLWTAFFVAVVLLFPAAFIGGLVNMANPGCFSCGAKLASTLWIMGVGAHPSVWVTNDLSSSRRFIIWVTAMTVGVITYIGLATIEGELLSLILSGHMPSVFWPSLIRHAQAVFWLGAAISSVPAIVASVVSGVLARRSSRQGGVGIPTKRAWRIALFALAIVAALLLASFAEQRYRQTAEPQAATADESTPSVAPAKPTANPYDAILQEDDAARTQALRTAIVQADQTTPDRAAEVRRLSARTGLSPDIIDRSFEAIQQRARIVDTPYRQMLRDTPTSPVTASPAATVNPFTRSLRGLGTLTVIVEAVPSDATQFGLTSDSLRRMVELRLRQNGIRVVAANNVADAALDVQVNILATPNREGTRFAAVYHVSIELLQAATKNDERSFPMNWHTGGLGAADSAVADSVRSLLNVRVDRFLDAYFAANPK